MKAPIIKDKQHRKVFLLQEEKQRCFKILKINNLVNLKWWARHKLSCTLSQIHKNRCIITYRGPATNRDFKLSRLEFRRWANALKLPGVIKGSW